MRKLTKRAAVIGTAVVLASGGAAYAASGWFLSNETQTQAAAYGSGDLKKIRATVTLPADQRLYPSRTVDGTITVRNPNDFPATVTGIEYVTAEPDSGHSGCAGTPTNLVVTPPSPFTQVSIAAGKGYPLTQTIAVTMPMSADSACIGATFTITLRAVAQAGAAGPVVGS